VLASSSSALAENRWVFPSDTTLSSEDADENIFVHPERTNLCNRPPGEIPGIVTSLEAAIALGLVPHWVRVSGSPDPHWPVVEARGQLFPGVGDRLNPFVTNGDLPRDHYSFDTNTFITLDDGYRNLLASGNFGDGHEGGVLEIEWEHGAIPRFARPAAFDRITVWGEHIWDCGHDEEGVRTEIHPPVGWVLFRNTATAGDREVEPPPGKRTQNPWVWYEATDHRGIGATFPSSALGTTPVQATVADAFFSPFGGDAAPTLNGCYDVLSLLPFLEDAPCSAISGHESHYKWMHALLDRDYSFFVPAPPMPEPGAVMIWDAEDRCGEVPSAPGNPPGDDIDELGEAHDEDNAPNAAPVCNIPADVQQVTEHGRPGIRVTVLAHSSHVDYPANGYVAFAKRYKVAWDYAPPPAQRVHDYTVDLNTLRVYDDAESCGEDGEWNMALRVNEQWRDPVRGSGDDGDPFWAGGAIDDDKCIPFHDPTYKPYGIGEHFHVSVVPGETLTLYESTTEMDGFLNFKNDRLPVVYDQIEPGTGCKGTTNHDTAGAHTICYSVTDSTLDIPSSGTLSITGPRYGPNADTGGVATRVAASSTIRIDAPGGSRLEYRVWKDGDPKPAGWTFDDAAPLDVDLSAIADGRYAIEFAVLSAQGIVSERRSAVVERDSTPPTLHLPAPISVFADQPGGKVVTYSATATDNLPGPAGITCAPPSGSLFAGRHDGTAQTTTVTCTATDAVGNTATGSFTVTVKPSFAVEVAADGPGWWYRVGEGSGTTMTATAGAIAGYYQNGVILGQPGAIAGDGNTAALFNGLAAYAYVNGIAAPTQAYTMEIWLKANAPLQAGTMLDHGGAGALYIKTDSFCFRQTQTHVCWSHAPMPGAWYHVVGTWDTTSKTARLYVNGAQRASGQAPSSPSGTSTFYVGYGQSAPWFKGYLDEAVYYPSALTATRVAVHYGAGCDC